MPDQPSGGEKTLFVIHTVFASVEPLKEAFSREAPWIRLLNLVDEAMLALPGMGSSSPRAKERFAQLLWLGEEADADAVLMACSTYSRVIDSDRTPAGRKLFWIDEPMMEEALRLGEKIGLLATNPETLAASRATLLRVAGKMNKSIEILTRVDGEAFESLLKGDRREHDSRVLTMGQSLKGAVDVLILAQASMSRLTHRCHHELHLPVLSSPDLCARAVAEVLRE